MLLTLISTSICRYQSLNLNHIREHSMPIYEFRWQRHTLVLSQERDGPYCHVVRWDGNNRESFGAKMGAEPLVVAVGQWMLRLSSGWTDRKHAERERERSWKATDQWQVDTWTSYSRTDVCLLLIFNISFRPSWSVFISVLCNLISFVLSVELYPCRWKSSFLVSGDAEHEVNMKFSMWE